MKPRDLVTIEQAYEALSSNDILTLLETFADGVDWLMPGPPNVLPYAGPRRGRQQVAGFFTALSDAEEIELFKAKDFIEGPDKVIVLGDYRARVRSTGRVISLQWVHILTLDNGKIDRLRGFYDTAAAVAAYTKAGGVTASVGASRRAWETPGIL